MENVAIKTAEIHGPLPGLTKLGGASLSVSFADLLSTTRIEDAGGLFAGRTDFTSGKAEAPAPAQDRPRDDGAERHEAKSENSERFDAAPAPARDNRDDGSAPVRDSQGDEPHDDGTPPEGEQSHGGDTGDDGSSRDETPEQSAEAPNENKSANDTPSNDDARTVAADAHVITPGHENATGNAQQVIAGLITGVEEGTKQNHVAAQANVRATTAPQQTNALDGLSRAADAIAKQTPTSGGNTGQANSNTHGNQAKANVQQAQAPVDTKVTEETAPKTANDPVQQALAKKIGNGARVQVNVVKEAAQLSSRPSATLTQTSAQTNDSGSKPQAGQATTHGSAPSAASSQAGQTAQQALAGQQAVQQAQAATQGGKGTAQGTLHVNAGQASEGANTSATAPFGEARQAKQAGEAKQAAKPAAPSQPRPAVADQVSVQITKALQSGVDKISIQLKPASMGRIYVQMAVAKDGVTSLVITADSRETLDLLQRDVRQLEGALKEAGLQADAGSMEFNMREGRESEGKDGGKSGSSDSDTADASDGDEQNTPVIDGYIVGPDGRVDIRA